MNMTEITLVGIITSVTLSATMMNADKQINKITERQAQQECLNRMVSDIYRNIDSYQNNKMYGIDKVENEQQDVQQQFDKDCKLIQQQTEQ